MPSKPSYNSFTYNFDLKIQELDQGGDTLMGGNFSIMDRSDNTISFNLTERSSPESGIYEYQFPSTNDNSKWSHFLIYDRDIGAPLSEFHYYNLTVPTQLPLPISSGGLASSPYYASYEPISHLYSILGSELCMFLDSENADYWLGSNPVSRVPDSLADVFNQRPAHLSAVVKGIALDTFSIIDIEQYPFNIDSRAAQDSIIHKLQILPNTSAYNAHAGKVMAYTQGASFNVDERRFIKSPIANITSHDQIALTLENVGVFYMGKNLQDLTNAATEVFDSFGSWIIYKDYNGDIKRGQISYIDYTSGVSTFWAGEEGSGVVVE